MVAQVSQNCKSRIHQAFLQLRPRADTVSPLSHSVALRCPGSRMNILNRRRRAYQTWVPGGHLCNNLLCISYLSRWHLIPQAMRGAPPPHPSVPSVMLVPRSCLIDFHLLEKGLTDPQVPRGHLSGFAKRFPLHSLAGRKCSNLGHLLISQMRTLSLV